MDLSHLDRDAASAAKSAKEERLKLEYDAIAAEMDVKAKCLFEAACEKVASS